MRKIFEVIIENRTYDVFDIEGKEHEGLNGEPKTWWLYYSERMPEGVLPPVDSESWRPWHKWIERHLFEIRFVQRNTTKEKWGETQFRNGTHCEILCNGKPFYSFGTTGGDRGMAFAMAKAQYMLTMMSEHPFNFFSPEKENGRKIYWYGLPATVKTRSTGWEISIVPDYTTGITKEDWWAELARRESKIGGKIDKQDAEMDADYKKSDIDSGVISWGDAFSDQHIDWFRKTE